MGSSDYSALYNPADAAGTSRFQLLGDNRRMYPLLSYGGLRSAEWLPHRIDNGSLYSYYISADPVTQVLYTDVFGTRNMISNGAALYAIGALADFDGTVEAVRHGVPTGTGGNIITNAEFSSIFAMSHSGGRDNFLTLNLNGEMTFRNTDASIPQYGAAAQAFVTNVGGTVTVGAGSGSITGNGTTFTTASIGGAASVYNGIYHGNSTSLDNLFPGDVILITLDSGNRSYHRIIAVNAATGAGALTVTPVVPTAATTKAYTLLRTGYASYSRVVTIWNGNDAYNYYVGHESNSGQVFAYVHPDVGASTHFTSPQTTAAGANVVSLTATDLAYYKGFLLYGNEGAVGWSVAGFPTSFTVAFGADDFPAGNVTVVDNTDSFVAFEYLGEQLIAIFENSMWQVQATGAVPEFNFYKLSEPVGLQRIATTGVIPTFRYYCRASCSSRNSIFYMGNAGLMQLSGQTAQNVSGDVWSIMQNGLNTGGLGSDPWHVSWEPTTDSVICSKFNENCKSLIYNVPTKTWSYFEPSRLEASTKYALTGNGKPQTRRFGAVLYSSTSETVRWVDQTSGAPFLTGNDPTATLSWIWASPVLMLGDQYQQFEPHGFQVDGAVDPTATWTLYEGKSPYQMFANGNGTVATLDNRRLLGKKPDSACMAIIISGSGTQRPVLRGVNIYGEIQGR